MSDQIFAKNTEEGVDTSSRNNIFPTVLIEKLFEYFENKTLVDIDLIVGTNRVLIQAHRVILSAGSQFFYNELRTNPNAKNILIEEIDDVTMLCVLRFIYTSSIELKSHSVRAVYEAAVFLKIAILKDVCTEFIENNINVENCLGFASLAWEHGMQRVLMKSLSLAQEHFHEVRNEIEFCQLTPEQLQEYLSSDFLRVDSEELVLESLIKWTNYDLECRKNHLTSLLSTVRYELMDPMFIAKKRETIYKITQSDEVVISWLTGHIEYQQSNKSPILRTRNMSQHYSILCGESTDDWSIMKYNGMFDTWQREKLPRSLLKRTFFKAVVRKNKIIIAGGKIGTQLTNEVECLNLKTKTWFSMASMEHARMGHIFVMLNGNFYVFGGTDVSNAKPLRSIELYEKKRGMWKTIGVVPYPIAYTHRYAVIDDQIYIMNFYEPKKIYCFNSCVSSWTQIYFDHDVENGVDMAAIGNCLYFCLSYSSKRTIERFNPAENNWKTLKSDGIERLKNTRMFAFGNKLIFWYKDTSDRNTTLFEMYNPDTGVFTPLKSFPESLYELNIK